MHQYTIEIIKPMIKPLRLEFVSRNKLIVGDIIYYQRSKYKVISIYGSFVKMVSGLANIMYIPKSGVPGITWNTYKNKWLVRKYINAKQKHIGLFDNLEDAKDALRNIQ